MSKQQTITCLQLQLLGGNSTNSLSGNQWQTAVVAVTYRGQKADIHAMACNRDTQTQTDVLCRFEADSSCTMV